MCGIVGIFNIDGKPISTPVLKKMTDVIEHRGPDEEGFWISSFIGFGHRRLSIIDLSPSGHQPMGNDDGSLIISYNGEIYNYVDIRTELKAKGYQFISRSDTEVLLRAYEEWGEDCVHKLNGMFAFAIWDGKKQRLFLARDRYGIKPLYYFHHKNLFIFASEIKAILQHPEISVSVAIPALNEYFTFQNIFSDLTLFKGIKLLPAASILSINLGDASSLFQKKYWDFIFYEDQTLNLEDCINELSKLFEQAVTRQLVSDVEIGSYLSGGIDSGSVTSVASKHFKNIKTFTCGFDLSSASGLELGFDERKNAEYLSNQYKTEHYEVVLKAGDMERVMSDLIWHLEDLRVGQSYPNYYVSRLASKFVKVILSGGAGDELFAGYPWRYYHAVGNCQLDDYVKNYYNYWQRLIPDNLKRNFFQPNILSEIRNHPTESIFKSVFDGNLSEVSTQNQHINNALYFEIKTFLHGLLTVEDKLSMAHGLEMRVPFLDNDLVDFAMKIPVKYKLRNISKIVRLNENDPGPKNKRYYARTNDGKLILRKALESYLPEKYTNGHKQGFSAPDGSWFKGESIEYIKKLLFDKRAKIYNYIQPETAQSLMNDHFSGRKNRRLLIWSMLCFEWWNRIFNPN